MTTQKQIAAHLTISTRMVRQLVEEGVFERPLDLDHCRESYIDGLRTAAGRGEGQLATERARLAAAQARRTERENARDEGRLVDADEVTAVLADLFALVRNRLRAIPRTSMTALGLTVDQSRRLLALIDQVLTELGRVDLSKPGRPSIKRARTGRGGGIRA